MSAEDSAPVGLQPGPMVVEEDVVAMVLFSSPTREAGGMGIVAEVRARAGMNPALVVGALRAFANSLEAELSDGACGCGEVHD